MKWMRNTSRDNECSFAFLVTSRLVFTRTGIYASNWPLLITKSILSLLHGGGVFNVNHYGDWLPISKIVHWEDFHFCWLKSKITIDFKSLNSGSGCASSPWRRVARRPQAHFWVQLWDFVRHCLGHHGAPWSLPSNCSANEDENKVSRRLCSWLLVSSVNDVRCF